MGRQDDPGHPNPSSNNSGSGLFMVTEDNQKNFEATVSVLVESNGGEANGPPTLILTFACACGEPIMSRAERRGAGGDHG